MGSAIGLARIIHEVLSEGNTALGMPLNVGSPEDSPGEAVESGPWREPWVKGKNG